MNAVAPAVGGVGRNGGETEYQRRSRIQDLVTDALNGAFACCGFTTVTEEALLASILLDTTNAGSALVRHLAVDNTPLIGDLHRHMNSTEYHPSDRLDLILSCALSEARQLKFETADCCAALLAISRSESRAATLLARYGLSYKVLSEGLRAMLEKDRRTAMSAANID